MLDGVYVVSDGHTIYICVEALPTCSVKYIVKGLWSLSLPNYCPLWSKTEIIDTLICNIYILST